MKPTDAFLIPDPQQQPSKPCPCCGKETYGPTYHCIYCETYPPARADARIGPISPRCTA